MEIHYQVNWRSSGLTKMRSKGLIPAVVLFVLVAAILSTQVSWILQAARIEESFLNQRVSMALCSAMDVLSEDQAVCSSLTTCAARGKGLFELLLSKQDKSKIDSVILRHLAHYNIDVQFKTTFSPLDPGAGAVKLPAGQALLFPASPGMQNILVKLEIPSKAELIRAQINGTFILSIVVLLLLIGIFFNTLQSLHRERRIRLASVDFINTMAHDLKTPISNITFAATLLSRHTGNISQPEAQYLAIIESEAHRLRERTSKILGIASVDALVDETPDVDIVDVHVLVKKVMESFTIKAANAGATLTEVPDAEHTLVKASERQLSSALGNLVDNALVHAGKSPSVCIRTSSDTNRILVEVSDNGPGIASGEQELVFRKGYRVNRSFTSEGFGLGLYLARTLVEKQGGKLTLASDGKSGCRFVIELPLTNVNQTS